MCIGTYRDSGMSAGIVNWMAMADFGQDENLGQVMEASNIVIIRCWNTDNREPLKMRSLLN